MCTTQPALARAEWSWTAAEGCIDMETARDGVRAALGAAPPEHLRIRATIAAGSTSVWRARIEVRDPQGATRSRELTSDDPSCHGLDDAVVVVAALLIDESLVPAAPTALAIEPTRAPPPTPVAMPSADSVWTGAARISVVGRVDELPGLAGAVILEVEVQPPRGFPLALSVGAWPPVERLDAGRGGRFLGLLASLGACPGVRFDPNVEIGGCGSVSLTYLLAEGIGVTSPRRAEAFSFSLEAAAFSRVRIAGALWARASIGLLVAIVRPRATLRDIGEELLVHEVAPVIPEGSLGLELRFE